MSDLKRQLSELREPSVPMPKIVSGGARRRRLGELAQKNDFAAFAVLDIQRREAGVIQPQLGLNSLDSLLMQHIEDSGDLVDCSLFHRLAVSNLPFGWETGLDCVTNEVPDPALSDTAFDDLLNEFGISGGYCVPVLSLSSSRGVVIYFGSRSESQARYPDLILETLEYFERAWYFHSDLQKNAASALSFSERSCIEWLAAGKTLIQMAKCMNLSEHTVRHLVSSASKKLDAKNSHEAVHKARLCGLAGDWLD